MTTLYLVTAHRQTNSKHTYPVGIFSAPQLAEAAAVAEEDYRGGKYGCIIQTLTIDAAAPDPVEGWPVIRQPPRATAPAPASPEPAPTPAPAYPRGCTLQVARSCLAWSRARLASSLARLKSRTGLEITYTDGIISAKTESLDRWLLLIAEVDALEGEDAP